MSLSLKHNSLKSCTSEQCYQTGVGAHGHVINSTIVVAVLISVNNERGNCSSTGKAGLHRKNRRSDDGVSCGGVARRSCIVYPVCEIFATVMAEI